MPQYALFRLSRTEAPRTAILERLNYGLFSEDLPHDSWADTHTEFKTLLRNLSQQKHSENKSMPSVFGDDPTNWGGAVRTATYSATLIF